MSHQYEGDSNKMVAKQEIQCERQIESSHQSDENDFKYGPGFVSKLRYKYLTLTLRQTTVSKQRPSLIQLRRTTSLNNLLDDEDGSCDVIDVDVDEEEVDGLVSVDEERKNKENGNCTTNGNHHTSLNGNGESIKNGNGNGIHIELPQNQYHYTQQQQQVQIRSSRSIEKQLNLKRARSVEALLRDDRISSSNPTIEDKIQSARDRPVLSPPKRLISLIEDDERPPPGITKQTMRIFEATNNKKRNVTRPMSNEIANKIALFKGNTNSVQQTTTTTTTTTCESKPPIIGKKPNVPPRTTSPHLNNSEKFAKFTKEKTALPKLDINIIKNNLETKTNGTNGTWSPAENKEIYRNNSSFSPANSDTSSPNVLSPFRNSMSPQLSDPPTTIKLKQTSTTTNTTSNNASVNSETSSVTSPLITSLSNKLSNLHMDTTMSSTPNKSSWNNSKSNNLLKIIDETVSSDKDTNGNNNHHADKVTNVEDSSTTFNGVSGGKVISFSPKINNNCKSEREPSPTQQQEIMKIETVKIVKTETQVATVQKPTHAPPAPPIAKTRDNEKSSTTTSAAATVGLKKKSSWISPQSDENTATSIVFNFSDRKDVPDYIDNDGLIIRKRRELPKVSHQLEVL